MNEKRDYSGEEISSDVLDSDEQTEHPRLAETVYQTDPQSKRLTGRTPEQIEEEIGISKEEIFPEDQQILYVGDPWQRMGLEIDNNNLTIIDYEYGEPASFIDDNSEFHTELASKINETLREADYLLEHADLNEFEKEWLVEFRQKITSAQYLSKAQDIDEYHKLADAWHELKLLIEEAYQNPQLQHDPWLIRLRKESWYLCVFGERGFRDIPDWENIIKPKLERDASELKNQDLTSEERDKKLGLKRKQYIEEIRLKKKPEKASIIEGVFPELPFKGKSFDRFIASWSISAHTFEELDRDGFEAFWQEISRILKAGGRAYIFPIDNNRVSEIDLVDSLKSCAEKFGFSWQFFDQSGQPESELEYAHTLILTKQL